jgi:hypothetical protein
MENLLNQYGSSHSTTRGGRNQQINWEYQPRRMGLLGDSTIMKMDENCG